MGAKLLLSWSRQSVHLEKWWVFTSLEFRVLCNVTQWHVPCTNLEVENFFTVPADRTQDPYWYRTGGSNPGPIVGSAVTLPVSYTPLTMNFSTETFTISLIQVYLSVYGCTCSANASCLCYVLLGSTCSGPTDTKSGQGWSQVPSSGSR